MLTALIVIAYLAIASVAWVHLYGYLYRYRRRNWPSLEWNGGDRLFGVLWGGFVCICWPLFAPFAALAWLVTRPRAMDLLKPLETLERGVDR